MKWEYANFEWEGMKRGGHRAVRFTHRESWTKIAGSDADFYATLRALGDDGWEMITHVHHPETASYNTWWFKRSLPE